MTNARGQSIDNTHLSVEQATQRGFIHRDYLAHCLRWSHVAKYLGLSKRYKTARILDIGCGKDMPLARTLMTMRMAPTDYLGIDYNKMEIPEMYNNTKFKPRLLANTDFSKLNTLQGPDLPLVRGLPKNFNYSVCFEMLEHVEPNTAIDILAKLPRYLDSASISWFSTPCFDEKVGAAKNHVNEMTYKAFGSLLEEMGYKILDRWGTFASIKDYKHSLPYTYKEMWMKLADYYDSNYLATIFAPIYPQYARNVLWETSFVGKLRLSERKFSKINDLDGRLGSSAKWRDILLCRKDEGKEKKDVNDRENKVDGQASERLGS